MNAIPLNTTSGRTYKSLSFSLRFLFLAMTITAVCCTLVVTIPGLGVLLALIVMSAFARTCLKLRHYEGNDKNSYVNQLIIFSSSLVRAAFITFLLVCTVPILFVVTIFIAVSGMVDLSLQAIFVAITVLMLALLTKFLWSTIVAVWCYLPRP